MKIDPFLMERFQSTYEHHVEVNLSESGVEPLHVRELLGEPAAREAFLDRQLIYTQGNGSHELRSAIAALYPGAGPAHVLVTTGCAEANFLTTLNLIGQGDEVVMMIPNYMQTWGLARGFGGRVREWRLRPDTAAGSWELDLDELRRLVTPRTRLILLCNPNNPTGACFGAAELDEICRIAEGGGAWILSDEVYRGAELEGEETPSVWGRTERTIVTCGLSKAYGLPGLRVGWIVGPPETVASLWSYHDYTTIAPSALSDYLAAAVLSTDLRARLLERTRSILRANYPVMARWLTEHSATLTHIPPRAGAMLYLRYHHPINSTALAERLRIEKSLLLVPGDHYGMDGYLRIGYGSETDYLEKGLERVTDVLREIEAESAAEAS